MSMLSKLHEWMEEKSCEELDDRALARRIRTAYRNVEPPTAPDDLFAKIRARAEKTTQLPPEAMQPTPPPLSMLRKIWEQEKVVQRSDSRRRSRQYSDQYRQFMDYALHQMRITLIDAGMRIL